MAEFGTDLDIDVGDDDVTLTGEIDAHTAPRLGQVLEQLIESTPGDVTLHMGGVTFMDSSGLQVMVDATGQARNRGTDLLLSAPLPPVRRLIELTGLDGHLTLREPPG